MWADLTGCTGNRFRKWLELQQWWSGDEEFAFRTQVRKDVLGAFARAEKEKKPPVSDIFTDVFAQPTPELREQQDELRDVLKRYPDEYDLSDYAHSEL